MQKIISNWLKIQKSYQKRLILIVDTCSNPNPINQFFANGPSSLKNFICLYQDTTLANNLENSPWLIELTDNFSISQISFLLEQPESNWGWLASMDASFTLEQLAKHWQQRMIIEQENKKFIYRFQDNRTISWHLQNLSETDISLLLGPIHSVLAWSDEQWKEFTNPRSTLYAELSSTPWADIPESDTVTKAIRNENMRNWLFDHYPKTLYEYSEIEDFYSWVNDELIKADEWQWNEREQWEFLLGQQLDPKQRFSTDWQPLKDETPAQHYQRCKSIFNKPLAYIETYIDEEKL